MVLHYIYIVTPFFLIIFVSHDAFAVFFPILILFSLLTIELNVQHHICIPNQIWIKVEGSTVFFYWYVDSYSEFPVLMGKLQSFVLRVEIYFTDASCKEQQKIPDFQNSSVWYLCVVLYCCHIRTGIVSPSFFLFLFPVANICHLSRITNNT